MTNPNCTSARRSFKHLTEIQRGRLEEMAKQRHIHKLKWQKNSRSRSINDFTGV